MSCLSYYCEVSRLLEIAQRTNNFYTMMILDVTSRLTPHKGLFRYTAIPFGVASAPAILQRVMESILRDLSHVCVYLDDILVIRESKAAHLHNLATVLDRFEFAGIHLKRVNCAFMLSEVLVSKNCSVFTSAEGDDFVRRNEIKHLTSAPYHPALMGCRRERCKP